MPDPTRTIAIAHSREPGGCTAPPNGPKSEYFPNVLLITHENRKVLFYDDLLRGKTVLIHFMSLSDGASLRNLQTIREVQHLVGPRLGHNVFFYSVTIDPQNDTVTRLGAFAEGFGANPGWLLLTGSPDALLLVKNSLFNRELVHHHGTEADDGCSLSMIRYGNEAVGLWGTVPILTRPEWIAQRISWVESRPRPVGPFRRRGPAPLRASAG